jgi:hypothetical protein
MSRLRIPVWLIVPACGLLFMLNTLVGCVNVKAPENIEIGSRRGHDPVDTSQVPENMSKEEARQKLAEAYERIKYLEGKVADLEKDKRELKKDKEELKDKYEREKKKNKD